MAKKKLVISTGAGMSAESGISTFRDSGGLGSLTKFSKKLFNELLHSSFFICYFVVILRNIMTKI